MQMLQLKFGENLELKNKFDEEHMKIIGHYTNFLKMLEKEIPFDRTAFLFRKLVEITLLHLDKEESLMQNLGFQNIEFIQIHINRHFKDDMEKLKRYIMPDRINKCMEMFSEKLMSHIEAHKPYNRAFIKIYEASQKKEDPKNG